MEESVGDTQLVEYIELTDDGNYTRLMGWPAQTDLSVKTSHTNGATLESWYPNTTPTAHKALQWKPYKIVKTIPHVKVPGQNHPHHGTLRYHKDVGWHYMPFRITGRPRLPKSMKLKSKIRRRAFVKLNKIKVKEIARNMRLPDLRLRRIDQQPGFRSLTKLLEVKV